MNKQTTFLRQWIRALFAGVLVTGLVGSRLFAEDFSASTTFDGVTTNTTDFQIGFGVSDITILITNGAQVINTGRTQIGYPNAPSSNTTLIITGGTSLLTNTAQVTVGRLSASNTLFIANGGRVYSSSGFMGGQDGDEGAGPSNNLAVVTGTGSLWDSVDSLIIGRTAGGNQMIITNGGVVRNTFSHIGFDSAAGNNSVIVTDSGSVWTNSSELNIGISGANNQLTVASGGQVFGSRVDLGGGSTSTGNTLVVSGSGATLTSGGELRIGVGGQGNSVTITNGGKVVTASNVNLGFTSNNTLLVTGSGSILSNNSTVTVGRTGANNRMTIENGGVVSTVAGYMGGRDGDEGAGASNNTAIVTGTGSLWNNSDSLIIGRTAGGNRLVVTNGGVVRNTFSHIGFDSAAGNNSIIVTDSGSIWTNSSELNIGVSGANNQLTVANGGQVFGSRVDLGGGSTSTGNTLVVSGSGATLTSGGEFRIGVGGQGNSATISNGGKVVTASNVNLGFTSNNTLLVTGAGSVLSNNSTVTVGRIGQANRMTIENGGVVHTSSGFMGGRDGDEGTGATNNVATVNGAGSAWINTSSLTIGRTAGDNQLIITNSGLVRAAGTVSAGNATVGNNSVRVVNDGVLETGTGLTAGTAAGNTFSNVAGIYQSTTASPVITPNGAGRIMMTNGTISYRGVTGADINNAQVGNISKSGNNGFRLNNASNAVVASYTFDSIANTGNPTNYQRLSLINNSRWTSANLTIGTGGGLTGGSGDVVEITQNFTINRNVNTGGDFDLASSRVLFSGDTGHTNAITGDDFGHNGSVGNPDGFTVQNLAYGRLSLGSTTDTICFQCGEIPVAPSNALYVTWLDLLGDANNVANLHSPTNINIYYMLGEPNNAYLNNAVYQLTDCNGGVGGLLMPAVPEPSALLLVLMSGLLLGRRLRRE